MLWGDLTLKGFCFSSLQEKGCGSWCIPIRESFVNKKNEDLGKQKRVKANETMFRRFDLLNVQTVPLKFWPTVFFFHAYLGYFNSF